METVKAVDTGHEALAAELTAKGVEFAMGAWVDILGRAKSKVVPIDHLPDLLAGSERYTPRGMGDLGRMNAGEDECVALPDPATLIVLPFDERIAFMNADLWYGGREPFANCPRSILKRAVDRAAAAGYRCNLGVELEMFVFREDMLPALVPIARSGLTKPTPAYDVESAIDALPFLGPMVRHMRAAGFNVYSFDHEGGFGQYEFDFSYDEALAMCDRMTLFRLMARQVAKEAGGFVTFMPKPETATWGSGGHMNLSLASLETGTNLFRDTADPRGWGWSADAYHFVAGLLRHAPALLALASPTVNSYKRLVPRLVDNNITWAPVWAAYGDNHRSCLIRLPRNRPCLENRGADAAANMYLATAFTISAGLDGMARGLDPGEPVDETAPARDGTGHDDRVRLPRTLLEAIDAFEADPLVHATFPAPFITDYVAMKRDEWNEYHSQVTDWERSRYLMSL